MWFLLYLAGYQIADGYLNREEETDKSFLNNPFTDDEDYNVMYRTGDLARVLSDGSLAIVGRRDGQVKIRGNRVELSEVEGVIRELDYVMDVTVQTIKNKDNCELVAYVVISGDEDVSGDIREYVGEFKPDYMVPSFVIKLEEIPVNVNGKVDKRALPKVDFGSLHAEYVAPTNEIEKAIVDAFEKVFNQEKIGIFDDFTRLGGDSLTAIKITSLLTLDLDVRTILNNRTPYKIAQSIENDNEGHGFKLVKKGSKNQNMFLIPDIIGLSFVFTDLIETIDFKGNIYIIDDFKYDLTLGEIKDLEYSHDLTLNHYYESIKNLFQDGDIIVGYSLGCVYATLVAEKLEQTEQINKCILIDGALKYVNEVEMSKEEFMDDSLLDEEIGKDYSNDLDDKIKEIYYLNSFWSFNVPKINSHVIYLAADSNLNEDDLKEISSDYEFISIDSNHREIIRKDCDKIARYFK